MYIQMEWDNFRELLEDRRQEWPREIPDCVWEYTMEMLEDCGGCADPRNNDPKIIVDNLAVNGSFPGFDEMKHPGESDEAFIARVEDEAIAVFPEERIVLYNFGF